MKIGLLTLHLQLAGCDSLKAKRSRLKPLLARLHKEFNISAAEVGDQDAWQSAVIACAMAGNDRGHLERSLSKVVIWMEGHWPDASVVSDEIEIIQ